MALPLLTGRSSGRGGVAAASSPECPAPRPSASNSGGVSRLFQSYDLVVGRRSRESTPSGDVSGADTRKTSSAGDSRRGESSRQGRAPPPRARRSPSGTEGAVGNRPGQPKGPPPNLVGGHRWGSRTPLRMSAVSRGRRPRLGAVVRNPRDVRLCSYRRHRATMR